MAFDEISYRLGKQAKDNVQLIIPALKRIDSKNKFNSKNIVNAYYSFSTGSGVYTESSTYVMSDFIPVSVSDVLYLRNISSISGTVVSVNWAYLYTFDSNKNPLTRISASNTYTITSGISYVRFVFTTNSYNNYVTTGYKTTFQINSIPTIYEDYGTFHYTVETDKISQYMSDINNLKTKSSIIKFTKVSDVCTITMGKACYIFKHVQRPTITEDTWRLFNGDIIDSSGNVLLNMFNESDIDGVVKEYGASDFIGGYHGKETYSVLNILADGILLNTSSDYDIEVESLSFYVESAIFHYSNTTKAFDRYKKITFENNKLKVENRWEVTDATNLIQAYMGLFSIIKDYNSVQILNAYSDNTKIKIESVRGRTENGNISESTTLDDVVLYGNGFTAHISHFGNNEYPFKGSVADYVSTNRIKVYFDSCYNLSGQSLSVGDVLSGGYVVEIK